MPVGQPAWNWSGPKVTCVMPTAKRAPAKAKTVIWRGEERSAKALASTWLRKLEKAFEASQSTRSRNAVYGYLTEVYRFAVGFDLSRDCLRVAARMVASKGLTPRKARNRFSPLIRATATVNEKTRWKWARCLRFALSENIEPDDLHTFILNEHKGINECADKW